MPHKSVGFDHSKVADYVNKNSPMGSWDLRQKQTRIDFFFPFKFVKERQMRAEGWGISFY